MGLQGDDVDGLMQPAEGGGGRRFEQAGPRAAAGAERGEDLLVPARGRRRRRLDPRLAARHRQGQDRQQRRQPVAQPAPPTQTGEHRRQRGRQFSGRRAVDQRRGVLVTRAAQRQTDDRDQGR